MRSQRTTAHSLLYFVYFVYFFCGLTQCFESVFLPEMKDYFHLSYQQQMYILFAKNIAFLLALVLGAQIARVGFKNCLTLALILFAAGTYLLIPGLHFHNYSLVLIGFFVIGVGFTAEMVAGNPLISSLGTSETAASRLNFGNALGAIAQIAAPASLSFIIPATAASTSEKLPYIRGIFGVFGTGLALLTIASLVFREVGADATSALSDAPTPAVAVWRNYRVAVGFVAIFLILGTEAGLFGFFRNYLQDQTIAGLSGRSSQILFSIYFSVFALGRLSAAWIQKHLNPKLHLMGHLLAAVLCLLFMMFAHGTLAVVAACTVGFFVSIFFPTLYALSIHGLGELTGAASGVLTMGFLGGAVLPVLQGKLADRIGLQRSYFIGVLAYLFVFSYTMILWRDSSAQKRSARQQV